MEPTPYDTDALALPWEDARPLVAGRWPSGTRMPGGPSDFIFPPPWWTSRRRSQAYAEQSFPPAARSARRRPS